MLVAVLHPWDEWRERQLKEGVYGTSTGIDGGNSGGCDDHHVSGVFVTYFLQKSGLSGARFTRKEKIGIGFE